MKRVLVVGSAEKSAGGVASVIRLMKTMPVWEKYNCYWLGTQIQRNYGWKLWYALKANFLALFIIWRYDIVHFHTVPDRIGLMIQIPVLALAKIGRKKIITHLHVGNQLYDNTDNSLFKWWLRKSNLIILLANHFLDIYNNYYKSVNTPATVVYNACDKVVPIPYEHHEKTILFAGAFRPNKGGDVLIRAFSTIHKLFPDWKLVMLGSGIEEERYKQLICELDLKNAVKTPGYIEGQQLKDYFQKAGIYCMCSYKEGFPMVVLEAWGYGVPVVSTPVGGLVDVIEENKNICVFEFGDERQLADQLSMLIENYSVREKMSKYSIQFSNEKFSPEIISQQLEHIYQSL